MQVTVTKTQTPKPKPDETSHSSYSQCVVTIKEHSSANTSYRLNFLT